MEHIHGQFDIKIQLGECVMAQAIGTFSLVVAPGTTPNPLALTPASGALPQETEGVAVTADAVATVSGGTPPYNYTFTGLPAGISANETPNPDGSVAITLAGTPAVGASAQSPYTVIVTVNDSATPSATASIKRGLGIR
jgi:hypothetical protein